MTTIDFDLDENSKVELFGTKVARWYQIAIRNQVESILEQNKFSRICVVSPTGTGKTVSSGMIFASKKIRKSLAIPETRKLNLLFIAHKYRLLTQGEETYADLENINFISQSAFTPIDPNLQYDIVCIDECHHEAMMSIQYQLDKIGDKPIIGLTATPDRADKCLIKFDYIVNPITRQQAVEQGFLAKTYLNTIVDTSGKDKTQILTDLFINYNHEMSQGLIFVSTKAQVAAITNVLKALNRDAVGIIDQTDKQLNAVLDKFSAQKIEFVINCNKISEGVDVKNCEHIILGRTVGSYPLLNQIIGRGARPDCDCNVWELINPLSGRNLDTTVIVGTPEQHRLLSIEKKRWVERQFNYSSI